MKRKELVIQTGFLGLVLLLAISLAGCKPPAPTSTPPPPPVTTPEGETKVEAGMQLAVHAVAAGAEGYRWELLGNGSLSTEGPADTTIYTAPEEVPKGGVMVQLNVTAYNDEGESPSTALIINIPELSSTPPTPPPGSILIKPVQDVPLDSGVADCHLSNAKGDIQMQGIINLSGFEPDTTYQLTLNGRPGDPPNEDLCSECQDAGCNSASECWWDFTRITTDKDGGYSGFLILPSSDVNLIPSEMYDVKFFVKSAEGGGSCIILGFNHFRFTIEQQ